MQALVVIRPETRPEHAQQGYKVEKERYVERFVKTVEKETDTRFVKQDKSSNGMETEHGHMEH